MRSVFLALFLLATTAASAAGVELLRIWPGWRDAASFERIGEYFGGAENSGRETVLRTQKAAREGFYFLVRTKSAAAIPGAKFEISVIRPDAPEVKMFALASNLPAKEAVFQVGITGADWPGGKEARPVAWKLTVRGADGAVLAEEKSYLWEKPAK